MDILMRCETCGEELDPTVQEYIKHLKRHKSKKSKPKSLDFKGLYSVVTSLPFSIKNLGFAFVLLVAIVFVSEFFKDQPIISPFDVPSDLKDFTGITIAELVIDRINNKFKSIQTSSSSETLEAGFAAQPAQPERGLIELASTEGLPFKMEVGGISLASLVSYIKRDIFRKETEIISGIVMKKGDGIIKIVAKTNKKGPWSEEGKDLENIIDKLAEKMAFDLAPDYMKDADLARFYSNNGKYEEADKLYKEITEKSSKEKTKNLKEAYIEWAKVLSKLNERVESEDKFKRASEKAPKDSNVIVEWGIALSNMGEREKAIEKYKEASEIDPKNPRIFREWGYTLYYLFGENKKAINLFEDFEKKWGEPKNADFYNTWGVVLYSMKSFDQAKEKYKKATQIDPENYYWAYYNWGLVLYNLALEFPPGTKERTDYLESSVSKYREALRINRKYADAYNNLGLSHDALGRYDEAINQYEKAIEINHEYYLPYSSWGYTLGQQYKYIEANEKYKKAAELNSNDYNTYYNWGLNLYNLALKYPEASKERTEYLESSISQYREALRINPKYADAYNNLGLSHNALGRYDEAIKQYEKAIEINHEYYLPYYNWGYTLGQQYKYIEANEKYKKAAELNPDYSFTYYNWGDALSAQHKTEEAVQRFKKFLELSKGNNPDLERRAEEFLKSKTSKENKKTVESK